MTSFCKELTLAFNRIKTFWPFNQKLFTKSADSPPQSNCYCIQYSLMFVSTEIMLHWEFTQ